MTDRPEPGRKPLFDYAVAVDPSMSAFGWRYIALSYLAVLLPLIGIALPRDGETHWGWVGLVLALAVVTMALNLWYLRRMMAPDGGGEPPGVVVLAQAILVTAATACLNYALSGAGGFYRPIILIPTILVAVIGNRAMVVVSGLVALFSLTVSTWAQGTDPSTIPAFVLSYGSTWALMILMIHLLSANALRSSQHIQGVADAAAIAAAADRLEDGLERLLPVIGAWAMADRVTAHGTGDGRTAMLECWPPSSIPGPPPSAAELEQARVEGGAAVVGRRAVLLADRAGDVAVTITVEGTERDRLDALSYHFHLKRMAAQLEMLVSRSRHIERLESLGRTDSLTGLPNRRALEEQLEIERAVTRRRQEPLTLAMLDLDDFKAYNDTHGHPAGDDLLRAFAGALRHSVRAADFVARYGGEEFCLLLTNTSTAGAEALLTQLRLTLRRFPAEGLPNFSAGIATWDGNESDHELLKRADRALYAAKARGKDCSVVAGTH